MKSLNKTKIHLVKLSELRMNIEYSSSNPHLLLFAIYIIYMIAYSEQYID